MFAWFTRLFRPRPLVLEVEQRPPVVLDDAVRESVRALAWHPGFQYLRDKLRLQRAVLEAQLHGARQESLREVEFLQSGVYWIAWLESQIRREVGIPARAPAKVTDEEEELIEAVRASIESVGH